MSIPAFCACEIKVEDTLKSSLRKHAHATSAIFHARKNDNFHLIFFYNFLIFAQTLILGTQ